MKKLILTLIFLLSTIAAFGQSGTISKSSPNYLGKRATDPVSCSILVPTWYWNTISNEFRYCSGTNVFSSMGAGTINGTARAVPFFGDSGTLSQDPTVFNYTSVGTLNIRQLAAASSLDSSNPYGGIFSSVSITPTTTSGAYYGVFSSIENPSDTDPNRILTAVRGTASQRSATTGSQAAYGGYFEALTGGNITLTNTTPLYGVYARAWGGHNGTTPTAIGGYFSVSNLGGGGNGFITDGVAVKATIDGAFPTTFFTNAKGLSLEGWRDGSSLGNFGTITNSYGIYADTSIDRGTSNRYFIYSLSTSPSLFSGAITTTGQLTAASAFRSAPDSAYDSTAWNGSNEFATKDTIRDQFESLVLGGGGCAVACVDTTTNSQIISATKTFSNTTGIRFRKILGDFPTSGDGFTFDIVAASGQTSGGGGALNLTAGNGTGTDKDGGALTITSGSGSALGSSASAGNLTLQGGDAGAAGLGAPAWINLIAGKCTLCDANSQGFITFKEWNPTSSAYRTIRWKFTGNTGDRILTLPDVAGTVALTAKEVAAKTSTYSLSSTTDNSKVLTNEGATAIVTFNLPSAAAGLTYTFYVQDTDGIRVVASAGDTIRNGASVSSVAGNISSSTAGSTITVVAINATEWVVLSGNILADWITA